MAAAVDDSRERFDSVEWMGRETGLRFGPGVAEAGRALLALPPAALYQRLAADRESQPVRWAARALIDATLALGGDDDADDANHPPGFAELTAALHAQHDTLRARLAPLLGRAAPPRRELLLERAPVRALAGAWLEGVSQPATQPSPLANRLFRARCADQQGRDGEPPQWLRHATVLAQAGLVLPECDRDGFAARCAADPASWMQGAFYAALGLYGANGLPEIVAMQWAHHALGIDHLLGGAADAAPAARDDAAACARDCLEQWAAVPHGAAWRRRLARALRTCLRLEALQVQALLQRVRRREQASLDERVASIVQRHAPFAGAQHGAVRLGGRLLSEQLGAADFDAADVVAALKAAPQLRPRADGQACRFLAALEFGGPMFGIFDHDEVATLREWAQRCAPPAGAAADAGAGAGEDAGAGVPPWQRIAAAARAEAHFDEGSDDERLPPRELFHRLVNVENFPCVLSRARRVAEEGLARAARLLQAPGDGTRFRYTDARFFAYSRAALAQRLESIYRDKLLRPIAPLAAMPSADAVVFQQKTYALGNLIDGAWAHRVAARGRHRRAADAALFDIHADEMGGGELRKNHIELIHRVLDSMGVRLPHIASRAFVDQEELLDELYPFANFQLSLAQFPDSLRSEILGFNLAIEMFGLGELRIHEIQKLRHWGYDTSYEVTHLSIDNFGSGHARVSFEAVASHLEQTARDLGEHAQAREWERVWTGYASFAQFVERPEVLPAELADYAI